MSMISESEKGEEHVEERHTEAEIIAVLEADGGGPQGGGPGPGLGCERSNDLHLEEQVRRAGGERSPALRELERENGELKKLVADLSLDREALKAVIRKNGWSL